MIARVGAEVDAWCTKCKMDLTHRIVAVLEAKPKRVECETCHSQHNYRKPKSGAAAIPEPKKTSRSNGASPKAKRLTKNQTELLAQWESAVTGKPKSNFARYSAKQSFTQDQLLDHATFGQGVVSEVLEDRKISVLFRDGQKVLAHARD